MSEEKLKNFNTKSLRSLSFSLVGLCLLLMFQNCGQEFDDAASVPVGETFASTLPFAYEFDIDQISYMSCNGVGLDADSRFFSFKAGAYGSNSGVYLRSDYKDLAEAGKLDEKQMADALEVAERNAQAGVVLAVRSFSNLQATSGTKPKSIGSVLFDRDVNLSLSQTDIAEQLASLGDGEKTNFFNLSGLSENRSFDGEITFGVNEFNTNLLRYELSSNNFILALTYATRAGEGDTFPGQRARSQYDPEGLNTESGTYVFGKGYNFEFSQYDPLIPGSQNRSISNVSRTTNLETRQEMGENWVCPLDEKYIIVRPQDALRGYSGGELFSRPSLGDATVVCPMFPDDIQGDAVTAAKWTRVRNTLSHTDWYVYRGTDHGLTYNCIVPKGGPGSCYGEANNNTSPSIVVQYLRDEDYPDYPEETRPTIDANCGPGTQKYCPHIMSICYKE